MNSYNIVKFIYNKKGIIDFDFLINSYKNGRLKDANVFAKLFAIDDNTPFKKENFNKDLFINFDISLQHWNDLIIFLKTGITNFKGNEKMEENTLVDLMYLTTKLGGIPSFDKYYEEFYEQKMINKKKYNPQTPEEDYKQMYIWKIQKDSNIYDFQNMCNDYEACKIFRVVPTTVIEYVYFRKLK